MLAFSFDCVYSVPSEYKSIKMSGPLKSTQISQLIAKDLTIATKLIN